MKTQITCPACQSPFPTDIFQIVDVGLQPELKEMMISGHLNVAQCPACGSMTQVATPLLYHDPKHQLFMVFVPMAMNLSHAEQQEQIGQLVKRAMDRLPAEQRRGYMLQPQTIFSMQTLMEKVLETEGITPEMIARQRSQADLLQKLLTADEAAVNNIIHENDQVIDETFFAMLQAVMDSASGSEGEEQSLKLINLRASLYAQTTIGKQLEKRQQAAHAMSREAKREGLSQEILLKHVLANRADRDVVRALVMVGQQAFDYKFFLLLSQKIEKREKAGVKVEELIRLRNDLLELQKVMEKESQEALTRANKLLAELVSADDKEQAVRANLGRIDDLLMFVLSASISQTKEAGNDARWNQLNEVREAIYNEAERQAPPEIRLMNQLVRAQTHEEQNRLLDENQELISPDLLELVNRVKIQAEQEENMLLGDQLSVIQTMITNRMVS